ncbi:MAG: hypothetical protein ABFD49_02725 [Armatimonadota bacterium]|nr:hypothetical protein [bacterium]
MARLLIAVVVFLFTSAISIAGPNPSSLKSFKVLVPDYSETNGGSSPAVAPDGEDIAYYSAACSYQNGGLYLFGPLSLLDDNTTLFPQKIDTAPGGGYIPGFDGYQPRNVDWSADGNSIAFVGTDGCLYIDQVLDPVSKRPGVPKLLISQGDSAQTIQVPRWSPDGTRIAYIRDSAKSILVCIVNVDDGKETVLADDAMGVPFVWQQPWSPDGKSIVYSGGKGSFNTYIKFKKSPFSKKELIDKSEDYFMCVSSMDGKRKKLGPGICPSWSPAGNRIAYTAIATNNYKIDSKQYLGYAHLSIWTCSSGGSDKRALTTSRPSKEDAVYLKAIFPKAKANELRESLSSAQSEKEMSDKDTEDLSNTLAPYAGKILGAVSIFSMDSYPIWSADGKKLLFVRGTICNRCNNDLVLLDIASGHEKVLVGNAQIDCVSWTKDSKKIVAQLTRAVSMQESNDPTNIKAGRPEIWMLELE